MENADLQLTTSLPVHTADTQTQCEYKDKPIYEVCKRIMDIVCSLLALIVLSPVLLITAIMIKREDGGPVLFRQIRLTKGGKAFRMYKFRSMCMNAEQMLGDLQQYNEITDGPAFKMKRDPRITKVGAFIRKTSIDELPQLINILVGDMSVIGPRPPLPSEAVAYTAYQWNRLRVKQGLSCYWQCGGRNNVGFKEWVELDLKYIRERSIWVDIKIIGKTMAAVLRMTGAR